MSTGFTLEGFPSVGSWVSYALGTENRDLPAYVAIPDPRGVPQQGPANWANGFLPAAYQGTAFNADRPIDHLARPVSVAPGDDRAAKDFLRLLNDEHLRRNPGDTELSGRVAAYELAARMQLSAPEAGDLSGETPATRALYGLDDANEVLAGFGRNCLLARRLIERGVRFVTLFNGAFAMGEGQLNWDGHRRIKSDYDRHGPILDRPAAALLIDLKARGLLDDTLVLWTTEFGRMPTFQKGLARARPQPQGLHRLARRRGGQTRLQLRRHRRIWPQGRRERRRRPRLPRHDPPPAGPRPHALDLLPQRQPAPLDRRPRPGHPRRAGVRDRSHRSSRPLHLPFPFPNRE